uniref:Uncharacterized protein n=1 Tax=Anopheles darlingi TaxID=43151 RepID=A0A2M4DBD2_ANODA
MTSCVTCMLIAAERASARKGRKSAGDCFRFTSPRRTINNVMLPYESKIVRFIIIIIIKIVIVIIIKTHGPPKILVWMV